MASSSDFASVSEKDYLNTLTISELFTYLKSDPDSANFKKVKRTLISRHDKIVQDLELHKNKCSQLMNELNEKKNMIVGLEDKVKGLEFDKIQKEGVIDKYKDKVICMERDFENVCEVEKKAVKRVVELGEENAELKCGKERAEEEVEAQKRRFKELERRVADYARGFTDIVGLDLQGRAEMELVKDVVSDHGEEKHGSDVIEANGGMDGALLQIKDVADSASAYSIYNSPVDDSDGGLNEGQPIVKMLLNPVASTKEQTNSSSESDNADGLTVSKMGFEVKGCSCKLNPPKLGVQRSASGDITESVDSEHKTEAHSEQRLSFTIVKRMESNHTGEETWSVKRKSKAAAFRGETDNTDDNEDQIPLSKRKVKLAKRTASGAHCISRLRAR